MSDTYSVFNDYDPKTAMAMIDAEKIRASQRQVEDFQGHRQAIGLAAGR